MRVTMPILLLFFSSAIIAAAEVSSSKEPILPLPEKSDSANPDMVSLGQMLFHDRKLSKDNSVSCSSCHNLQTGGVDGRQRSIGINGSVGDINAPTVFNSAFNFRQFWNGRAKSLEEQVEGPVQNPKEMGSRWEDVLIKLKADSNYVQRFNKIFPDGITKENIKRSIATFERTLITPNSKFDRYLRGDHTAINAQEILGYQKFKSLGCVACHQGMNVGGNMFQTMGVMGNYFADRKTPETEADLGRFQLTHKEHDKHVFRVPSLRNVALTAPYFHDGSAKTLEEAVSTMAKYQLGRKLSQEDLGAIVKFLRTLTGETPKANSLEIAK